MRYVVTTAVDVRLGVRVNSCKRVKSLSRGEEKDRGPVRFSHIQTTEAEGAWLR